MHKTGFYTTKTLALNELNVKTKHGEYFLNIRICFLNNYHVQKVIQTINFKNITITIAKHEGIQETSEINSLSENTI